MFETFGNKKGIMDLVTKKWDKNPHVQRDESLDEKVNRLVNESYENMVVEHYQSPADDGEPDYIPLNER